MKKTTNKKALIIVDVQPSFLNPRNRYVVGNILSLLKKNSYDMYVVANFHAEKGSLWDKQQHWTCSKGAKTKTVTELTGELISRKPLIIEKSTKSVFAVGRVTDVLRMKKIKEVYIAGLDTNDCVLATSYHAFDCGFLTYVIENCCEASSADLHRQAIKLLRHQHMTDKSRL